jgi:HemK-related putative methylase
MKKIEIDAISKGLSSIHKEIKKPVTVQILRKTFAILPGVFRPDITEATIFQIENTKVRPTDVVWEVGCGSGIQSIFLALKAKQVLATDINPMAVKNTKQNALKFGLDNLNVRKGSLTKPIKSCEIFDLVVFNPPFFKGKPASILEKAWFEDARFWPHFFKNVKSHLKPSSRLEICYSSFADLDGLIRIAKAEGFKYKIIAEKRIRVLHRYDEKLLLLRFSF